MKVKKTIRGFNYFKFKDVYNSKCSIQKSSLATDDCIWFGIDDPNPLELIPGLGWKEYSLPKNVMCTTRMHLNRKQVKRLIPILQKFVETGEI